MGDVRSVIDMFFLGDNQKKPPAKASSYSTAVLGSNDKILKTRAEKSGFGFTGAVVSDGGCVRSNNEDNFALGSCMNLDSLDHCEVSVSFSEASGVWRFAGVFDGMGGGEMGELASRETAAIFVNAFGQLSGSHSKTEIDLCIRKAFLNANNQIVDFQKKYNIFGTTGTVLCANGDAFKIYHLGDSRAYLVREDEFLQLTKDQTLAQMKLEIGMYREDDPAAEADKHKLTEYIGRDWTRENIKPVESRWILIQNGDCVLLCSDGLYDMCPNEEIARILRAKGTAEEKAAALVGKALFRGGEDNVTCVVISFT